MTGASFETVKPRARRPRITSGCGVGCDRSKTSHNPSDVPFPTVERGSSTDPGGASPPGSAAAEAPSVPDDQVALPVPWDPTIIHILGAVTTMPHHPSREQGWVRSTCQGDAAGLWCASRTGMALWRARSFLSGRGVEPWCVNEPRVTPTTHLSATWGALAQIL